ncbi:unnamed protein product [Polarella glacialis]|uniref:Uncharacterized protein n=1 Tax=Polarella glacialis TaxID=89957 RepID=A0A813ITI2_POLGL|nr:unnamed protein product [Polarella glacialis]
MALVRQADGRYSLQAAESVQSEGSPISSIAARLQLLGSRGSRGRDEGTPRQPRPVSSLTSPQTGPDYRTSTSPEAMLGIQLVADRISRGALKQREAQDSCAPSHAPLEAEPEELRSKLLLLGASFFDLHKQVEADSRRRKELEENRSQEILAFVVNLEQRFISEAVDRERDWLAVQKAVEQRLAKMVDHLQSRLQQRFSRLSKSVDSLCERCSTVERGIQQFKGELPSKLQVDTAALKSAIRDLSSNFSSEQHRCCEQDGQVLRRLEEGEYNLDSQLQQELAQLERRGEALQEIIDQFAAAEGDAETQAQQADIFAKISSLKSNLSLEVGEREQADDKVVQAINEYTSTHHRSLTAANASF